MKTAAYVSSQPPRAQRSVLPHETLQLRRELDAAQHDLQRALTVVRSARHLASLAFPVDWRSTWMKCSRQRYQLLLQALDEFDRHREDTEQRAAIDMRVNRSRPYEEAPRQLLPDPDGDTEPEPRANGAAPSLRAAPLEVDHPSDASEDGSMGSSAGIKLTPIPRGHTSLRNKPFISIYPSKRGQFNISKAAAALAGMREGAQLRFAFDKNDLTKHFYLACCEDGDATVIRNGPTCHFNYTRLQRHLEMDALTETARFILEEEPVGTGGTPFYKATLVE